MKFWRQRKDEELDAEIRSHLDEAIRDRIARGEAPDEARTNALREFGNVGLVKEVTRETWGWAALERLGQDLRFGLRMLRKNPGFSLIAILTLALGIGANTAIFSVVSAVLLRPLPAPHAEQLVAVIRGAGLNGNTFSHPDFLALRERNDVLAGLAVSEIAELSFGNGIRSEMLTGEVVSGNYFSTLGLVPVLGRTFQPEEDRVPGAHPVVVVSHTFWQSRLDGAASVVGRNITLNNQRFTIIGVAPAGFTGTSAPFTVSLWLPAMMSAQVFPNRARLFDDRRYERFAAIGRLKPGITAAQAQAALELINQQLEQAEPPRGNQPPADRSLKLIGTQGVFTPFFRSMAQMGTALLAAVVGIVLLLACTNVANLLLARATARRKEIAVRLALGASRWRLLRQLLTESALLALLGALVGLLFAFWLNQLLMAFKPPLPASWRFQVALRLDWAALGFTLGLALVTTLLFGLAPAWQASKPELVQALKTEAGMPHGRRLNLRHALVVVQVTISLLLLVGAGLFLRSLLQAQQLDPGFQTRNRLTFTVMLGHQGYDNARQQDFARQVIERLSALPGVHSVTAANFLPMGVMSLGAPLAIEGRTEPPDAPPLFATAQVVSEGYFETLGTALLHGRAFTAQDTADAAPVVIINEQLAHRFWPNESALGKRLRLGPLSAPFSEIVGVAQDTLHALGEPPQLTTYRPLAQQPTARLTVALHATGVPQALIANVRRAVMTLDPNLPLQEVNTLDEVIALQFWPMRICAALLAAFGLLGLILAATGIYGVMSYTVTERTREVGIRIALGAAPRDVRWLIVRRGLGLTLLGTVFGLSLAFMVTRWLSSLLYGVSVRDPLTFVAVPLLLAVVALLACYVPARRATKVDPLISLRHD